MEEETMDVVEDSTAPLHEDKKRRLEAGVPEVSQASALPEPAEEGAASRLPLSRVKDIVKTAATLTKVSKETLKVLSAATELFLEDLARKAYNNAAAMKRKTVTTNDLLEICNRHSQLHFLPDSRVLKPATPHKKAVRSQEPLQAMETEP
jgi:histone H3/H4